MPIPQAQYEAALNRPLTPEEYARLVAAEQAHAAQMAAASAPVIGGDASGAPATPIQKQHASAAAEMMNLPPVGPQTRAPEPAAQYATGAVVNQHAPIPTVHTPAGQVMVAPSLVLASDHVAPARTEQFTNPSFVSAVKQSSESVLKAAKKKSK